MSKAAEARRQSSRQHWFLTPERLPGEVQVDFGEADFRVRGVVAGGEYPTVSFPRPDVGPAQVFWGEFGYVPFDADGARPLHQAMSDGYEGRSVTFATNVGSGRWGTVFADYKLAAAIVGRVARLGMLAGLGGPGHTLEESLMLGKTGLAAPSKRGRARDETRKSCVPEPE